MADDARTLLVLGKPGDRRLADALEWLRETWNGPVTHRELPVAAWPADLLDWSGDCLVSYRCPAIVPAAVLSRTRVAALNFHPGSPEYRGIGAVNFALYEGATTYGVTCHEMAAQVDSGPIVAVRRFPIADGATVASVLEATYTLMADLFREVMTIIREGKALPLANERWSGPLRTRRELNALCVVSPDMTPDEIQRRVRAVDYPGFPGAHVTLGGVIFRAGSASSGCGGHS